jgi:hypothetical protein
MKAEMTMMTLTQIPHFAVRNHLILLATLVSIPITPNTSIAATVWSGPTITFSKADGADASDPANQDRLTGNVWITRGNSQGLYNAKAESGYGAGSPADTEWAFGTTADYSTLSYSPWVIWNGNCPPCAVGQNAVLHLKSDDIYVDITMTGWSVGHAGGVGGFSYVRSTPGAAANSPPSVAVTNPPNNTTLAAPASLVLSASAFDPDGTVTNVQFFRGAASLGNTTSAPYSVPVNNLAAGDYTFSAVATDNGGLTATNQIAIHVVNPVTVSVGGSSVQRPSTTSFQFSYSANAGLTYIVQRSLNLINWSSILTNVATNSTMAFRDGDASASISYYRVGRVPNP